MRVEPGGKFDRYIEWVAWFSPLHARKRSRAAPKIFWREREARSNPPTNRQSPNPYLVGRGEGLIRSLRPRLEFGQKLPIL